MGSEQSNDTNSRYAFANTSWSILEDDGETFAIALLEPSTGVSLVLAMRRPSGSLQWSTTTNDGSLEAWLHRSYTPGRQLVSFDDLNEFWHRRPRIADQSAFSLEGHASITMDENVPKSIAIDLQSTAPMPLYRSYFEADKSPWARPMEWYRARSDSPDKMHATIKGKFSGYWYDLSWRLPI